MKQFVNQRAIVVTGGPGMGKTSVIDRLSLLGYQTRPESGRKIIQRESNLKGDKLPWKNQVGFAEEMFAMGKRDYRRTIKQNGLTFFDRGLPDVIGYLRLCQLKVPEGMLQQAEQYRYHQRVFIMPPWPEIYETDQERKQSLSEAVATYDEMVEVYRSLDYQLIEVPRTTVQDRTGFLLRFFQ
ncbi:MAG: AAA family ATPase [Sphingobacterium sp.]